ncbi:MAG: putative oxidoreductase [Pseudohongiellaceae bacterium]|jgi:putative oxidoreductase
MQATFEKLNVTAGRVILGLYFFLPGGLQKVFNFQGTADYMAANDMFMVPFFLVLTIILQLGGGAAMIVGYQTKLAAFLLAGLTLMINLVIHDFWTLVPGELQTAHEMQNFVKNLGIVAGLMVCAGLGGGAWSLDAKLSSKV